MMAQRSRRNPLRRWYLFNWPQPVEPQPASKRIKRRIQQSSFLPYRRHFPPARQLRRLIPRPLLPIQHPTLNTELLLLLHSLVVPVKASPLHMRIRIMHFRRLLLLPASQGWWLSSIATVHLDQAALSHRLSGLRSGMRLQCPRRRLNRRSIFRGHLLRRHHPSRTSILQAASIRI